MNEGLAALRRQVIKPMLEHALQEIRNQFRKQIKDTLKLGSYLEEVTHDVLENLELFQVGDTEEVARLDALAAVLSRCRATALTSSWITMA